MANAHSFIKKTETVWATQFFYKDPTTHTGVKFTTNLLHEDAAYIVRGNNHKAYINDGDWIVIKEQGGKPYIITNIDFAATYLEMVDTQINVTSSGLPADSSVIIIPKDGNVAVVIDSIQPTVNPVEEKIKEWIEEDFRRAQLFEQHQEFTYVFELFWGIFYIKRYKQLLISIIPGIVMIIPLTFLNRKKPVNE